MPRSRDITDLPETKDCEGCGNSFTRPRRRGYQLSHHAWARRRFCSDPCRRTAFASLSTSRAASGCHPASRGSEAGQAAGNARARKLYPDLGTCERCPAPAVLRHHRDEDTLNNDPENIEYLCKACHTAHHKPASHRKDRVAA